MKKNLKSIKFLLLLSSLFFISCTKSDPVIKPSDISKPSPSDAVGTQKPSDNTSNRSSLIGVNEVMSWDKLSQSERNSIKTFNSLFFHQSVGGDLEDAANVLGYKFEYSDSTAKEISQGLNGTLFTANNGETEEKINEFKRVSLLKKDNLNLAIMKFGYADVMEDKLNIVKEKYLEVVKELKNNKIKVLHVTPPLVYNLPADNLPKMKIRNWMIETFKDDVIFDLQDIESFDISKNTRCEREGNWEICDSIRSTKDCPSLNQGVDAPSGQGHLCHTEAQRLSKAFMYSIYLSGK